MTQEGELSEESADDKMSEWIPVEKKCRAKRRRLLRETPSLVVWKYAALQHIVFQRKVWSKQKQGAWIEGFISELMHDAKLRKRYEMLECEERRNTQSMKGGRFEKIGPRHYRRNVVYDRTVFCSARYFGSPREGKAGIIVIDARTSSLLLVQSYGGLYSIPKGSMERGEDPCAAALRELKEETGMNVSRLDRTHLQPIKEEGRGKNSRENVYLIKVDSRDHPFHLDAIDLEISAIGWFPIKPIMSSTLLRLNKFTQSLLPTILETTSSS